MSKQLTTEEKLKKFEEWTCDECGVRKSTGTKGANGPSLCNECAGLTLEVQ